MRKEKKAGLALALILGLSPAAWSQAPLAPAVPVAAAPAAATAAAPAAAGGGNIWSFLCPSAAQKAACQQKICTSGAGQLLNGMISPLSAATGGVIPPLCPPVLPSALAQPADSAVGAAARIQADEAAAKQRRAAVRYLGTVDCRYWPEATAALVNALRADRNECVRIEAALSLLRGCCCNKATIRALTISVNCDDADGNPIEPSSRVRHFAALALERCLTCYTERVKLTPASQMPTPTLLPAPREHLLPKSVKPKDPPILPPEEGPKGTSSKAAKMEKATARRKSKTRSAVQPEEVTPVVYYKRVTGMEWPVLVEDAKKALARYAAMQPVAPSVVSAPGGRSLSEIISRSMASRPLQTAAPRLAPTTVTVATVPHAATPHAPARGFSMFSKAPARLPDALPPSLPPQSVSAPPRPQIPPTPMVPAVAPAPAAAPVPATRPTLPVAAPAPVARPTASAVAPAPAARPTVRILPATTTWSASSDVASLPVPAPTPTPVVRSEVKPAPEQVAMAKRPTTPRITPVVVPPAPVVPHARPSLAPTERELPPLPGTLTDTSTAFSKPVTKPVKFLPPPEPVPVSMATPALKPVAKPAVRVTPAPKTVARVAPAPKPGSTVLHIPATRTAPAPVMQTTYASRQPRATRSTPATATRYTADQLLAGFRGTVDIQRREFVVQQMGLLPHGAADHRVVGVLIRSAENDSSALVRIASLDSIRKLGIMHGRLDAVLAKMKSDRDPRVRMAASEFARR